MSLQQQNGAMDMSDVANALPGVPAVLTAEDRANVVAAIKDKLQSLARLSTDVLDTLSPKVRKRVERLVEIQKLHDEIESKFFEERAALEEKYQKLYEPLYAKRYGIVTGEVDVEGAADGADAEVNGTDKTEEQEKGVPDFWLNALKTNDITGEEIQERDEDALKYLKDIKWSRTTEPKGFKLDFFFDPNPFFKNAVLTKTYEMIEDDEPILEKATGTEIEWYPGKCLTKKVLRKKPKKGGAKDAKPVTKVEDCASFFNFFTPPSVPEEVDDLDEEEAEELQNQMEQDYDVGATIRDKIIPHAVSWFTGEAVPEDDLLVDDEEEEEDLLESSDDDDFEEEEDEEEDDAAEQEDSKEKPSA